MKITPTQRAYLLRLTSHLVTVEPRAKSMEAMLRSGLIEYVDGHYRITPKGLAAVE